MAKLKDLTGLKFNRLTVIKLHHTQKIFRKNKQIYENKYYWLCKCECGNEKVIEGSYLRNNRIKSCGCLLSENGKNIMKNQKIKEIITTHGKTHTRLYKIFAGMKRRCFNKNEKAYKNYGGRGIKICNEWLSDFMNFYNWAMANGYSDDLTIDRIDNNGNYEPSNCRWVNYKEQARNRRQNLLITYKGETHCLSEWAEIVKIDDKVLSYRLKNNWSIEKVLTTPERKITKGKKVRCIETNEIFKSTKYAGEKFNINYSDISACCNGRQKSAKGYHWEYVE